MSAAHALTDPTAAYGRRLWWVSALLGLALIALGVAVLAWPDATVRVVGLLFGLNLLIAGLVRTGLSLFLDGYPAAYRVLGVLFGVLTAIVGILCLRNIFASAILLVLFIAIGWLLEGVGEVAIAVMGTDDPIRRWRLATGALHVVAAVVVLIWPALSLTTFLAVGAVILIAFGIAELAVSIGWARAGRSAAGRPAATVHA